MNYENWLNNIAFIEKVKSLLKLIESNVVQNFIFDVWKKEATNGYDENVEWLLENARLEIINQLLTKNYENWLNNTNFIKKVKRLSKLIESDVVQNFIFDIWFREFESLSKIKEPILQNSSKSLCELVINRLDYYNIEKLISDIEKISREDFEGTST